MNLKLGGFVGPYQLIEEAPLDYIKVSRYRAINGREIKGSWSTPWWAWSPEERWVLIRRWKNKLIEAGMWTVSPEVPAKNVLVVNELDLTLSIGAEIGEY